MDDCSFEVEKLMKPRRSSTAFRVAQPYDASTNNLPTRGRFSPFLFSGISFSTGGYSAEYGEALSSVLLLNTLDEPDQNKTDIALMTVGLGNRQYTEMEKKLLERQHKLY